MKVSSSDHFSGFAAEGGGMLCISDLGFYEQNGMLKKPCKDGFELGDGITDVEAGVFDLMPQLRYILIAPSVRSIGVTEKTREIFEKNDVCIIGRFDTYAESFAREQRLRFVHDDIELASEGDYFGPGHDIITLCLYDNGTALIHEDCRCQGISAGNTGGGECDVRLPKDFYLTHSANDIADLCWGSCYSAIMKCGALKSFLAKAKKKRGFCFRFNDR